MNGIVPADGTSLFHALAVASELNPRPDNIILLTDGLPTVGKSPARASTILPGSARSSSTAPSISCRPGSRSTSILFPMEGDPLAASAFWKLAIGTRGSFMSMAEDWP